MDLRPLHSRLSPESAAYPPGPATRSLATRTPIGRRKRDTPETWGGLCEFYGNRRRSRQFVIHMYHAALLLFAAGCVLQEEPLSGSHHTLQGHQRTVRVDHKCLGTLVELRAFTLGSVNDNGNVQINPPAAAALQP
jgi:hypothetical protein